jgi:hypothetical protein
VVTKQMFEYDERACLNLWPMCDCTSRGAALSACTGWQVIEWQAVWLRGRLRCNRDFYFTCSQYDDFRSAELGT